MKHTAKEDKLMDQTAVTYLHMKTKYISVYTFCPENILSELQRIFDREINREMTYFNLLLVYTKLVQKENGAILK